MVVAKREGRFPMSGWTLLGLYLIFVVVPSIIHLALTEPYDPMEGR
jgi:hypothetical protein